MNEMIDNLRSIKIGILKYKTRLNAIKMIISYLKREIRKKAIEKKII